MKLNLYTYNCNNSKRHSNNLNSSKINIKPNNSQKNFSYLNQLGNLNKIRINFCGANNSIDYNKIRELKISNLRILSSKLATGATFSDRPKADLNALRAANVTTMIDLRKRKDEILEKNCFDSGIKYVKIPLDGVLLLNDEKFFYRNKDKSLHIKDEFIEILRNLFETIDNETCYMACRHGIDRTNIGILLNYFLNKNYKGIVPEIKHWGSERIVTKTNQDIELIKKLLKAMTDEQKAKLGLTQHEIEKLKEKIYKLKAKNRG